MLGAIIGDIVGSRFEFIEDFPRDKNFAFFAYNSRPTDDSFMTLAVADALLNCHGDYENLGAEAVKSMVKVAEAHPDTGWGLHFYNWLFKDKKHEPYNSYGNGAGMRVSPVAWIANDEEVLKTLSKSVTEVSHNHPEGVQGAEAVALATFLARKGASKETIRARLTKYYPKLKSPEFTVNNLRYSYGYDLSGEWITCRGSVPQAVEAFLESENFEDAIRNAVCIGGDSDTIGAMTGAIAEAYYGVPDELKTVALSMLTPDLRAIYDRFYEFLHK